MDKKKILILIVLFVAVAGMTINSVSAKTYTKTVKFKDSGTVNKYLGKGEYLGVTYSKGYSQMSGKNNIMTIGAWSNDIIAYHYKVTKAKIKFTKKINGKTKVGTKTYYADKKYGVIDKQAPKGWKPYSAIVAYKDI